MNPWDEVPVGKHHRHEQHTKGSLTDDEETDSEVNPSRRCCKHKKKADVAIPCDSGIYFFDAEKKEFVRQAAEPTKIIIEAPPPTAPCKCKKKAEACEDPEDTVREQVVEERIVPEQADVAALVSPRLRTTLTCIVYCI